MWDQSAPHLIHIFPQCPVVPRGLRAIRIDVPIVTRRPEGASARPPVKEAAVNRPELGAVPLLDGRLLSSSLGPDGARDDEVRRRAADRAGPHLWGV